MEWLPPGCALKQENLLLDVGRQEQQVEELAHPRPREAQRPRHLGLVAELPSVESPLKGVGEGELTGHTGRIDFGLRLNGARGSPAPPAHLEGDDDLVHTATAESGEVPSGISW